MRTAATPAGRRISPASIEDLIECHLGYRAYHIVLDRPDTHKSAPLARLAARLSDVEIDLGVKGHSGTLKSMETREEFLCRADHRVVFHYTPRHASRMNQIEIRFGIPTRKAVRRGDFLSTDDLRTNKRLAFVDYFYATMAKPFRWTYQGKPLVA